MNLSERHRFFVICVLGVAVCFLASTRGTEVIKGNIVDVILNEKNSFFYLDKADFSDDKRALAIGVFDSGTGGLTVLDAVVNYDSYDNQTKAYKKGGDGVRDFTGEYFVYLGDKANMPYGNYAKEGKTELLKEHIIKDAQFLLGSRYYVSEKAKEYKEDKPNVKAIVIACNTATAFGKEDVEEFVKRVGLEIKVIGVIDAGAKAALSFFQPDESATIGVMATAGTVSSQGYVRAIDSLKDKLSYNSDIEVFQQAGVGIAGAIDGADEYIKLGASSPRDGYKGPSDKNSDVKIDLSILTRYGFEMDGGVLLFRSEGGRLRDIQLNSVNNYIRYHLVTLMEKIRKDRGKKLKAIILGCTHYPFYSEVFGEVLSELYNLQQDGKYVYRDFMAERIELVDPAPNVARELYEHLRRQNLFNEGDAEMHRFYLSVPNSANGNNKIDSSGGFPYEYKYGRDAGFIQEYVKRIPFSKECIGEDVVVRLSKKMPVVYEMIYVSNPDAWR